MATLATSQQWLDQSSLLLEARPQTTRISCRYSVKPKPARRASKTAGADKATKPDAATAVGQNPRAKLVLKTIDPASGVCLKYKTTKAAEVSRLVQLLGQLSRRQAGLVAAAATATTEEQEDVTMAEADAESTPAPAPAASAPTPAPAQQAPGGGGGKGKKKKGKR